MGVRSPWLISRFSTYCEKMHWCRCWYVLYCNPDYNMDSRCITGVEYWIHIGCWLIGNYVTLRTEMFGVGDFWLETRVIIKISKIPYFDMFSWELRKDFFCFEKKNQSGSQKKAYFSKSPILESFCKKILGLVLGLVEL